MGGAVAVTIREEDGTEHRMCRWTNGLDWFFRNIKFFQKDGEHVQGYLKNWNEMREDYEKHKKDKQFENNMTTCYAPYPYLAPEEYGLIVVDMKENVILDNHHYLFLPKIHGISLLHQIGDEGEKAFYTKDNEAYCFRELWEGGKILFAEDPKTKEPVDIAGLSVKGMMQLLERKFRKENSDVVFTMDMSPYRHERFTPKDSRRGLAMKERLAGLGFSLSEEEEKIWKEWLKNYWKN